MTQMEDQNQYREKYSVIMHRLLPMFIAIVFGLTLAFLVLPGIGFVSVISSASQMPMPTQAPVTQNTPAQTPLPAVPASAPAVTPVLTLEVLKNDLGYVNVRSGASTNNPIIAKATPGEKYTYTVANTSWYQITLPDGKTGFINKAYVNDITGSN